MVLARRLVNNSKDRQNYNKILGLDVLPSDAITQTEDEDKYIVKSVEEPETVITTHEAQTLDLQDVQTEQWMTIFSALNDPRVSELEINGPDSVWVMVNGHREALGVTVGHPVSWVDVTDFSNTMSDVEAHSAHYGKSYKDSYCIWEGGLRLKDLSGRLKLKARFHCVKPPTCDFPIVTIAKQSSSLTSLDAIQKSGSMTKDMMNFIKVLVKTKQTIVFSGGTGAGKTTFMSACCAEMNPSERVGIYEDAPELDIHEKIPNSFNMMSYPEAPGEDAKNQASLDWCVRQGQRQRVDRLLIGESRGPEFQSFITAANSGFNGSMTTLHANNPRMALDKMASFLKRAPGNASTPMSSINHDIAYSINYIIQLERVEGRGYRVTSIEEVSRIVGSDESANVKTQPIFTYDARTDTWTKANPPEDDLLRESLGQIMKLHTLDNNVALDKHTKQQSVRTQSFINSSAQGGRFGRSI